MLLGKDITPHQDRGKLLYCWSGEVSPGSTHRPFWVPNWMVEEKHCPLHLTEAIGSEVPVSSAKFSGIWTPIQHGRFSVYRLQKPTSPWKRWPAHFHKQEQTPYETQLRSSVGQKAHIFFRLSLLQLEYCKMLICLRILLYIGSGN